MGSSPISLQRQRRIYIAGPMTGIPLHNVPAFEAAAKHLRDLNYSVVIPPEISKGHPYMEHVKSDGTLPVFCYQEFVRLDYVILLACTEVVVLPGWENSKGARGEVLVANQCGFPIYELDKFPNEQLYVTVSTTVSPK